MNLTEPQAGSDLNAVKTRAERAGDGTYRLFGQKIFITYGEHDMAENIVHLVLARLPGAPAGTRGLSLFLAPKFLVSPDGSLGAAQRPALRQHRAQARHSRLADLRHDLWRKRRRQGLAGRRGKPRSGGDVRDDERGAARASGRKAWRSASGPISRRSPLRASAVRAGAQGRRRHGADHRASRRPAHRMNGADRLAGAHIVDRDDAGVFQLPGDLGLPYKSPPEAGIGPVGSQLLEGHLASQVRVTRQPDPPDTAGAGEPQQGVTRRVSGTGEAIPDVPTTCGCVGAWDNGRLASSAAVPRACRAASSAVSPGPACPLSRLMSRRSTSARSFDVIRSWATRRSARGVSWCIAQLDDWQRRCRDR